MQGFLLASPQSNAGKTWISLALMRALKNRRISFIPAKCGPDYIDSAFHHYAAGVPSFNLDPWAMRNSFITNFLARYMQRDSSQSHIPKMLVVEGMMGLFDGAINGQGSCADLSNLLDLPIFLILDCAKQAHSIAALVYGFKHYRPGTRIEAIILNKVGSARHEEMLRTALKPLNIPILGAIYRHKHLTLEERYLGLSQAIEQEGLDHLLEQMAKICENSLDMSLLLDKAMATNNLRTARQNLHPSREVPFLKPLADHIAIAQDEAFQFLYAHQLYEWRRQGATISFFSPLKDEIPALDAQAIFLCGGYPELYGERIAKAEKFKKAMHKAALQGKLIYGECGGYMLLGESLEDREGVKHAMLGLLPLHTSIKKPKLHLGYRKIQACGSFPWQMPMRGHEFHYSTCVEQKSVPPLFAIKDACDNDLGTSGMRLNNICGSYMHIIDRE